MDARAVSEASVFAFEARTILLMWVGPTNALTGGRLFQEQMDNIMKEVDEEVRGEYMPDQGYTLNPLGILGPIQAMLYSVAESQLQASSNTAPFMHLSFDRHNACAFESRSYDDNCMLVKVRLMQRVMSWEDGILSFQLLVTLLLASVIAIVSATSQACFLGA